MKYIIKNGRLKKFKARKDVKLVSKKLEITVNGRDGLVSIFASFAGKVVGMLAKKQKITTDNVLGNLNVEDTAAIMGNMVELAVLSRYGVKPNLHKNEVGDFTDKIIDRWKAENNKTA